MPIDLTVPIVGESITEVEIGSWLKAEGDSVSRDENVVTIESEKATVELPSPVSGKLTRILKKPGQTAAVGEVIAHIEEGAGSDSASTPARKGAGDTKKAPAKSAAAPAESAPASTATAPAAATPPGSATKEPARVMPAAQRVLAEKGVKASDVTPTGPGGRILKEDAENASAQEAALTVPEGEEDTEHEAEVAPGTPHLHGDREEEVVPMTPLRRTIARRLVEAQRTAAMLTTFNEIDMSAVMSLRKEYQDLFLERYKTKLGFMSFFVKAVIDALKQHPQVNAEIRENNVVYHDYYDIGVAIGGGKGLVVPVLRNAERLSFAEIEVAISDLADRAQKNKLKLEELQGGTFTISNGGIYGSLLSTPILNPPQSGILGMHSIQDRPVARDGQVVIRPMMYVALTYDHRLVDGREAVIFLKRVKDVIERPARMLVEV